MAGLQRRSRGAWPERGRPPFLGDVFHLHEKPGAIRSQPDGRPQGRIVIPAARPARGLGTGDCAGGAPAHELRSALGQAWGINGRPWSGQLRTSVLVYGYTEEDDVGCS